MRKHSYQPKGAVYGWAIGRIFMKNDDTHETEMVPLAIDERFTFSCNSDVACFNECCRDLNQFLTPYDVLRIKQGLKLTASQFIEKYCLQHVGPESGLPVLTLKPKESTELICPFVTPTGCHIYENRPSSCRMYPLARAISRARETGRITEHFALLNEPHCLGCSTDKSQTVKEWIESQKLETYNQMNDLLMEAIAIKNQLVPGPMDLKAQRFFYLACYDLDNFRTQIFENNILKDMEVIPDMLGKARTDDVELLKIGMNTVIQFLTKEYKS